MWWGFEEERERGTSRDFLQPVCVCETVSEMGSRLSLLTPTWKSVAEGSSSTVLGGVTTGGGMSEEGREGGG